jgi:hypothetical protein
MAMNIGRTKSSSKLRIVMPPKLLSDENTWWVVSTVMMSL